MARCNHISAARKPQGLCLTCHKPIETGQGYKRWDFRYRPALKLHTECQPRRSWLTGSEILGTIWDMVDDYAPEGDTPEDVAASLREFGEQVEADIVEGLFQEKLENMEGAGTGLENTPVYQDLEERMEEMRSYAEQLGSVADEIESHQDADEGDEVDADDLRQVAQEAVDECPE